MSLSGYSAYIRAMEEEDHPVYESIEMAAEPGACGWIDPANGWIAIPHPAPRKTSKSADPIQGRIDSVLGLAVA
jgi:hypothetical protein